MYIRLSMGIVSTSNDIKEHETSIVPVSRSLFIVLEPISKLYVCLSLLIVRLEVNAAVCDGSS